MTLPTNPAILRDLRDPTEIEDFAFPLGVEGGTIDLNEDVEEEERSGASTPEGPTTIVTFQSPWSVLYLLQTIHGKLPITMGESAPPRGAEIQWLRQLSLSSCIQPLLATILLYASPKFAPAQFSSYGTPSSPAIFDPNLCRPICSLCLRILEPLLAETPTTNFKIPARFQDLCDALIEHFPPIAPTTEAVATHEAESHPTTPPRSSRRTTESLPSPKALKSVRSPRRSPPASPLRSPTTRKPVQLQESSSVIPALTIALFRILEHNYQADDQVSTAFCTVVLRGIRALLEQSINSCLRHQDGSSAGSSPSARQTDEERKHSHVPDIDVSTPGLETLASPSRLSAWRDESEADARFMLTVLAWSVQREVMGLVALGALMDSPNESVRVLVAKVSMSFGLFQQLSI